MNRRMNDVNLDIYSRWPIWGENRSLSTLFVPGHECRVHTSSAGSGMWSQVGGANRKFEGSQLDDPFPRLIQMVGYSQYGISMDCQDGGEIPIESPALWPLDPGTGCLSGGDCFSEVTPP